MIELMPFLLYDGHCRFCRREVRRLHRMVGNAVTPLSFQEPGVLERFPALTHGDCMRELKLIHEDGRIEGGVAAVAGALRLSQRWRGLAAMLDCPVVRGTAARCYRIIARFRYGLGGPACPDGTCRLHV
jgi:predicted DCC family thiol-disulfide oxidoreductase YuxK